jgi:hypothetical protein
MSFDFGDEISLALQDLQAQIETLSLTSGLGGSPQAMFDIANRLMDVPPEIAKGAINVEDSPSVTVGSVYLVNVTYVQARHLNPSVASRFKGVKILVPFLGGLHHDPEIEAESEPHWHIDWRFLASPMYEEFSKASIRDVLKSRGGIVPYSQNLHLAIVINQGDFVGKLWRKALICRRPHALYNKDAPFLPWLERAHRKKRVCENRCPHRQISLAGAPESASGVRVCPGHGLSWDREGKLVPRCKVD